MTLVQDHPQPLEAVSFQQYKTVEYDAMNNTYRLIIPVCFFRWLIQWLG